MVESESESRSVLSDSFRPHGLYIYSPWNSPGQNIGVGSLSLLQGIFPTQGSNPGLPHSRWIPYQLSHKGSPSVAEPLIKNQSMSVWLQNSLPKLLRRPPPTAPYFTEKKEKNRGVNSFSSIWKSASPAQRSKRLSSFVLTGSVIPPSALRWGLSHLQLQCASPASHGGFSISNPSEALVAITTTSCSLPEPRVRPEGMSSLIVC